MLHLSKFEYHDEFILTLADSRDEISSFSCRFLDILARIIGRCPHRLEHPPPEYPGSTTDLNYSNLWKKEVVG